MENSCIKDLQILKFQLIIRYRTLCNHLKNYSQKNLKKK